MDLTTGIAPRAWLAGLLAGLFAFASITGTSASTQSGSAWVFRDGEDDYGWGCILEGQFSTASDSRLFGRTLYLSVWIDDFDYDEDDYDYVGLTSDPGARLQSGGASAASIVVFYPISGRSRTYTVRNRNPEFNSLEVLRGNFYDDIRRETELPGAENAVLSFMFPDGTPFGTLPLAGFRARVGQFRSCQSG